MKEWLVVCVLGCVLALCQAEAVANPDKEIRFVEKGIKHAAQLHKDSTDLSGFESAIGQRDIKRAFTILFDVPADKLFYFIDPIIYGPAIELLKRTLKHPNDHIRLEVLRRVLNQCRLHETIPRIFSSYKSASTAIRKRQGGMSLTRAVEKTLSQQTDVVADVFESLRSYLNGQHERPNPVVTLMDQSFEMGLVLQPSASISDWHTILLRLDSQIFVPEGQAPQSISTGETQRTTLTSIARRMPPTPVVDGAFQRPLIVRKAFSTPHALHAYLSGLPAVRRSAAADMYKEGYEDIFDTREPKALSPLEWTHIYQQLKQSHPHLLGGIFSLPENKALLQYHSITDHPFDNHVKFLVELIRESQASHPEALRLALHHILRKKSDFKDQQILRLSPKHFLELFAQGRLKTFEQNMTHIKEIRLAMMALEQEIMGENEEAISDKRLSAMEQELTADIMQLERILGGLNLDQMRGFLSKNTSLPGETVDNLQLTTILVGQIYGERNLPKLRTLRTIVQGLRSVR